MAETILESIILANEKCRAYIRLSRLVVMPVSSLEPSNKKDNWFLIIPKHIMGNLKFIRNYLTQFMG
uniref:Uncharacterized protein n=1 Tax=Vespula pensylvanica TaxID=30213 RepID=A0A834N764_VESPE|nr:hypothetical protein H0235_016263 [Vespula pensylvanica]